MRGANEILHHPRPAAKIENLWKKLNMQRGVARLQEFLDTSTHGGNHGHLPTLRRLTHFTLQIYQVWKHIFKSNTGGFLEDWFQGILTHQLPLFLHPLPCNMPYILCGAYHAYQLLYSHTITIIGTEWFHQNAVRKIDIEIQIKVQ